MPAFTFEKVSTKAEKIKSDEEDPKRFAHVPLMVRGLLAIVVAVLAIGCIITFAVAYWHLPYPR